MQTQNYNAKKIGSAYGVSAKKTLSDQTKAVFDILQEVKGPIHKDANLREMLLEVDALKNMPFQYYEALSDVLLEVLGKDNNKSSYTDKMPIRANA